MKTAILQSAVLAWTLASSSQPRLTFAQSASAQNVSPSLDDTIKWLVGFVATATGAKRTGPSGYTTKEEMSLSVTGNCEMTSELQRQDWKPDGSQNPPQTGKQFFSLADIDPASITVQDKTMHGDPPLLSVVMTTHNHAKLVKDDTAGNIESASIASFVDLESANRAAKAFRHAATLCARLQPF